MMKTVAVFALCLAVALAGPEAPEWWRPQGQEGRGQMQEQERGKPEPSAYVQLRGRIFRVVPEAEGRAEPRAEPRAEAEAEPERQARGIDVTLSREELVQFEMYKKYMAEKKAQKAKEQAQEMARQEAEKERREQEEQQNAEYNKLEEVMGKVDEIKKKFVFKLTLGLAKVCNCAEGTMDVDAMFGAQEEDSMMADAAPASNQTAAARNASMAMESEVSDQEKVEKFLQLVHGKTQLTAEIVGKMKQMKNADMKKLAFGGLVKSLCWQYKSYASTLKSFKARFQEMAAQQQNAPSMS